MRKMIGTLMVAVMLAAGCMAPVMAVSDPACDSAASADVRSAAGCDNVNADESTVMTIVGGILNAVIGFVAVIAVVVIVIAGINMTVSQGDPGKVAKARNMILYAVIGLVVAILAFAIVNFVLDRIF